MVFITLNANDHHRIVAFLSCKAVEKLEICPRIGVLQLVVSARAVVVQWSLECVPEEKSYFERS